MGYLNSMIQMRQDQLTNSLNKQMLRSPYFNNQHSQSTAALSPRGGDHGNLLYNNQKQHQHSRNQLLNPDVASGSKPDMTEWPAAGINSSFMSENNYFAKSQSILQDVENTLEKSRKERMSHK